MDALLDPDGDPTVRRRVPRVLKACPTDRAAEGLREALDDPSFEIRSAAAAALASLHERGSFVRVSREEVLARVRRELDSGETVDRQLPQLFALLSLTLERGPLQIAWAAMKGQDRNLRGTALEYLANVLPDDVFPRIRSVFGASTAPLPFRAAARRAGGGRAARVVRGPPDRAAALARGRRGVGLAPESAAAVRRRSLGAARTGGPHDPAPSADHADRAPLERQTIRLAGLSKPAEIVVDRWGIPHIYAAIEEDLFFAQGWNAARDRLWQLDLWRRQGEGKLAEAFGPRFVDQDRAARLFLYRGDLDAELRSYHPRARRSSPRSRTGSTPSSISRGRSRSSSPSSSSSRARGPVVGASPPRSSASSVSRGTRGARSASLGSSARWARRRRRGSRPFEPPSKIEVPTGLDLSLVDESVLKTYALAHAGVTFKAEDLAASLSPGERARVARAISGASVSGADGGTPRFESNNWAVSGRLSASGRPILAGDPHRTLSVPSLRYVAHLVGPGWNVIGAGEPALPGISLGHNERIAWALTIFSFADEEDLYVYDTNPENPRQYRYRGRWVEMRTIEEQVPVKGAAPRRVTLRFTRHGPVLFEDAERHKAYALRAAYLQHEGTAAYLGSLRLDQARDWSEFVSGAERHYTPSLNMLYADVSGNVGWFGTECRTRTQGLERAAAGPRRRPVRVAGATSIPRSCRGS